MTVTDVNRDQEYTRELGLRIKDAFHRGNTVLPTHVVAFAVYERLRRLNPSFDLYRRYDLLYVRNWSIAGDLSLLGRTTVVVGLRSLDAVRSWVRGSREVEIDG